MSNTSRKRKTEMLEKALKAPLLEISPLTDKQKIFLKAPGNAVAHGSSGTGKTFMAMYKALKWVQEGLFDSVTLVRSAVATRDMGFLPGTEKDKAEVYEAAYRENTTKLFDRGDAYEILKTKKIINFITTSFLRGITFEHTVVIVDECQNMTYHELDSLITRIGPNCIVMFCGDWMQADLRNNGIVDFYKVLRAMDEFTFVEFGLEDIVRSELVKSYLTTKHRVLNEGNS